MVKKIAFLFISALLLAACSLTSTGEKHYLQSRNGVPITVPPPLTDANISHFYDLPQQNQNALVSVTPPSDPGLS